MTQAEPAHTRLARSCAGTLPVLLLVMIVSLPLSSPAQAHPVLGYTNEVTNPCDKADPTWNRLDGGTTKVRYDDLEWPTYIAIRATLNNTYDPTNLKIVIVTNGSQDLKMKDKNYSDFCGYSWDGSGGGTVGLYNCFKLKQTGPNWGSCDKAALRFDTSYLNSSLSTAQRVAIACHEVAHGAGFKHELGDCVSQFLPLPSAGLNAHHINEINDTYNPL